MHGSIKLKTIIDEFSISRRQATRDIDYLRYSCGAPLEYDTSVQAYRYAEPFEDLDFLEEDALLSRVLIHRLARSTQFIPLTASELDRRLEGFVPPRLASLEASVRFELSSFEPVNRPLVSAIMKAMSEKRRASIRYTDMAAQDSERLIEPRRLVNYSGAWYCFAVDVDKAAVRNFKLSRMRGFDLLDARQASAITDEALDALIDSAYGAYKGPLTIRAAVRFYGPARAIVEHEVWHPDQKAAEGSEADGRQYLELTIPVYRFEELLGRVLRFGSNARPVAPTEFIDIWQDEIRRMYANISGV